MLGRQLYFFSILTTTVILLAMPWDIQSQDHQTTPALHESVTKLYLSDLMLQRPNHAFLVNQGGMPAKTDQLKKHIMDNAFFCALERRIEGKAQLPLRMRLGHLDYVNGLERKNQREAYTFYQIEKHSRK